MKNQKPKPDLKGRPFNGTYYPKIKRIRTDPRHRIRQLLRSFIPLAEVTDQLDANQSSSQ